MKPFSDELLPYENDTTNHVHNGNLYDRIIKNSFIYN